MVTWDISPALIPANGAPREGVVNLCSFQSQIERDYRRVREPKQASPASWEMAWIDIGGES